ncbi:MAG: ABC transporter permease subunit [Oligoflexia bacterium]|nr:ABC transporter permease subunit [Oligoflexia bacterium]
MKKIWIIAKKDFKTFFISPIGYMVISSFLLIIGYMFYQRLVFFVRQSLISMQMGQPMEVSLNDAIIKPLYGTINLLFLFIIPLITMRLIAEEKKLKTIELLLTSPVTTAQLVAGKFLSALLLVATTLAGTLLFPVTLYIGGNPDMGQIFTMYLGLLMISACYISVGLFWSSLTENQIIAAVLTFVSLLFLWIIDWSAMNFSSGTAAVISYFSVIRHFESFIMGIIDSKDVVFYLTFCVFGLFLSYVGIESKNWQ